VIEPRNDLNRRSAAAAWQFKVGVQESAVLVVLSEARRLKIPASRGCVPPGPERAGYFDRNNVAIEYRWAQTASSLARQRSAGHVYFGTGRSIRSETMIDETSNGFRQCRPIGLLLGPSLDCRSRLVGQVKFRRQVKRFGILSLTSPGISLELSPCHGSPPAPGTNFDGSAM
jgi:hypothetical protein